MYSLAQKRYFAKKEGKDEVVLTMREAENTLEALRRADIEIAQYMDTTSHPYKDLVFRFIDRMNDPCEDVDSAEKILDEFTAAFDLVWGADPDKPELNNTFIGDESDFVTLNRDGGVEGLSESSDVSNGDDMISEGGAIE